MCYFMPRSRHDRLLPTGFRTSDGGRRESVAKRIRNEFHANRKNKPGFTPAGGVPFRMNKYL